MAETGTAEWLLERAVRAPGGCLLWQKSRTSRGYPKTTIKRRTVAVHRLAYKVFVGPIPAGLRVLHTCDVQHCIEPSHLFVGTDADNAADRDAKGRGGDSRGEANGMVKLTDAAVVTIRLMAESGATHEWIAGLFGVRRQSVSRIVSGQRWAHVPGVA